MIKYMNYTYIHNLFSSQRVKVLDMHNIYFVINCIYFALLIVTYKQKRPFVPKVVKVFLALVIESQFFFTTLSQIHPKAMELNHITAYGKAARVPVWCMSNFSTPVIYFGRSVTIVKYP